MPTRRPKPRRPAWRYLLYLLWLPAPLVLAPLALLVLLAETRPGRVAGWGAILLLASLLSLAFALVPRDRPGFWPLLSAALLVAGLGMFGWLANRPGRTCPPGLEGLRGFEVGEAGGVPARAETIPEIDLVKLGLSFLRFAPPGLFVDRERIRTGTLDLYRQIEADPVASAAPSVSGRAVAELLGMPVRAGHYYAYIPPHGPGERLPAIVFLHGNGGNLKAMPWAWKPYADRTHTAIVCPTFGFGFWGAGGAEAVESVRLDAIARLPIDPARVALGGLSDGGVGVTRAATRNPEAYRRLIYVSPTMRPDDLSAPAFLDAWRGRPVLVVTGGRDANVRQETVDPAVALLRDAGVEVTYRPDADEDHYLFFNQSPDAGRHWLDLR